MILSSANIGYSCCLSSLPTATNNSGNNTCRKRNTSMDTFNCSRSSVSSGSCVKYKKKLITWSNNKSSSKVNQQHFLSNFVNNVFNVLICFLLIPVIFTSSTLVQSKKTFPGIHHGSKHIPRFIGDAENTTIPIGKEATLKCNVENLGNHRVTWVRVDPVVTILTLITTIIAKDSRLRVTNDNNKLWSLHVKNVTTSDRGWYMCQINSEPMIERNTYLDILVPPSIDDNETSSDIVLDERNKLSLHCKAHGYPTPTIIWRREDGKNLSTGFIGASKIEGEYLNISQVTRDDMGAYLCIASNGVSPSRSKRIFVQVNFPPKIKAVQLSVGAIKGSHVDLQCEIEASPKPLTSWIRTPNFQLHDSVKYKIEETVSSYNLTMKLRINDLEEKDFAGYKCVTKNTLGEREGRLRVYEISPPTTFPVPVKSTSSTHKPTKKVITASTASVFSPNNVKKDKERLKVTNQREMAQKRESFNNNGNAKKSNYETPNTTLNGSSNHHNNQIKSNGVMIKQLGYKGLWTMAIVWLTVFIMFS